jgi:hypothetical protein
MGNQLDNMTRAMGRRLPIVVKEGKRRPHEPIQAPSSLQGLASSFRRAFLSFHIGKITKRMTHTIKTEG